MLLRLEHHRFQDPFHQAFPRLPGTSDWLPAIQHPLVYA